MSDQMTADATAEDATQEVREGSPLARSPRVHTRVRAGMSRSHNWIQLFKFAAVGGVGYVVNMLVYAIALNGLDVHYMGAAVIAFVFAVTNNFLLNRHWTFDAKDGHAGFQAARFLTVSVVALGFNLIVLKLLVTGAGLGKIPAQAIAVIAATPLNFLGNKLWSFRP